jgi:acyl dehydratase
MPVTAGKTYPPVAYGVTREKIRQYAVAVAETSPLYFDLEAARVAGYADLVAPPMFAAVYAWPSMMQWISDPEHEVEFHRCVHAAQRFRWGPVVLAGDTITTVSTLKSIDERGHIHFYVSESVSTNQRGQTVSVGTWTNIVRDAQ